MLQRDLTASTGLANSAQKAITGRLDEPTMMRARAWARSPLAAAPLSAPRVPSSSFSIIDEKPTTSAARIAARRRVVIRETGFLQTLDITVEIFAVHRREWLAQETYRQAGPLSEEFLNDQSRLVDVAKLSQSSGKRCFSSRSEA